MGIHGEPGIEVKQMTTADNLTDTMVEKLLADMPLSKGDTLSVMVNGLGATPKEELLIVYRRVHQLLTEKGVRLIMPHVGEYATSMEMAGLSVQHPVLYQRQPVKELPMLNATTFTTALGAVADIMKQNRDYLISLDQRNGDGDLGISMDEGFAAAYASASASEESALGKLLVGCSKAFNEAAPSSLGTRTLKGNETADVALFAQALTAGVDKIMERAGSKPGQKTVLDALDPAAKAITAHAEEGFAAALQAAADAARAGAESTKDMKAVHGRAAYYGDKALGLIDGGAVAGTLIFEALAKAV